MRCLISLHYNYFKLICNNEILNAILITQSDSLGSGMNSFVSQNFNEKGFVLILICHVILSLHFIRIMFY